MDNQVKREFLPMARKFIDQNISEWWLSEKLDGIRTFWDGGVSRGVQTSQVPWANDIEAKIKPTATGLWSQYGNPIIAPDWFLNQLPTCLLDGHLFSGRGRCQTTKLIIDGNSVGWDQIRYCVFGSPSFSTMYQSGEIKGPHYAHTMNFEENYAFYENRSSVLEHFKTLSEPVPFEEELRFLLEVVTTECGVVDFVPHAQLPSDPKEAAEQAIRMMHKFLGAGGAGVVLHSNLEIWQHRWLDTILTLGKDTE